MVIHSLCVSIIIHLHHQPSTYSAGPYVRTIIRHIVSDTFSFRALFATNSGSDKLVLSLSTDTSPNSRLSNNHRLTRTPVYPNSCLNNKYIASSKVEVDTCGDHYLTYQKPFLCMRYCYAKDCFYPTNTV